ncbi:hypothetical protein HMI55_004152 [Coelomomyces lativittatus]|nr:hypothetical protein HMI55_004152 [Coelomomyces lativittatus]
MGDELKHLTKNDLDVLNVVFNRTECSKMSSEIKAIDKNENISTKAISSLPEDTQNLMNKYEMEGIYLAEQNKLQDALAALLKASSICPENASVLNNIAQTLRLLGENTEALNFLNKAIQYAAGDPQILRQGQKKKKK